MRCSIEEKGRGGWDIDVIEYRHSWEGVYVYSERKKNRRDKGVACT